MNKRAIAFLLTLISLLLLAGCAAPKPAATPTPEITPIAVPEVSAVPEESAVPGESTVPEESAAPAASETNRVSFGKFTATDLNGNEVTQDIFSNHDLTMINIWATFCPPCLEEMPELGALSAEYADKGVQIVGIVADAQDSSGAISASQVDLAKEIVQKTGASYTHLLPSEDLIRIKLDAVTYVPETVFVDMNGDIVGEPMVGSHSKDDWKVIIDKYLKEVKK